MGKNPVSTENKNKKAGKEGFTLIEVSFALVIILVALLGVVFSFTYVINYNAGNNSRARTLAVLQREIERLRALKFTPTTLNTDLRGGTTTRQTEVIDGSIFNIQVVVDNDISTAGVQDEAALSTSTLKEITVTASLSSPSPGWQTAIPATAVLRRTRSN